MLRADKPHFYTSEKPVSFRCDPSPSRKLNFLFVADLGTTSMAGTFLDRDSLTPLLFPEMAPRGSKHSQFTLAMRSCSIPARGAAGNCATPIWHPCARIVRNLTSKHPPKWGEGLQGAFGELLGTPCRGISPMSPLQQDGGLALGVWGTGAGERRSSVSPGSLVCVALRDASAAQPGTELIAACGYHWLLPLPTQRSLPRIPHHRRTPFLMPAQAQVAK